MQGKWINKYYIMFWEHCFFYIYLGLMYPDIIYLGKWLPVEPRQKSGLSFCQSHCNRWLLPQFRRIFLPHSVASALHPVPPECGIWPRYLSAAFSTASGLPGVIGRVHSEPSPWALLTWGLWGLSCRGALPAACWQAWCCQPGLRPAPCSLKKMTWISKLRGPCQCL